MNANNLMFEALMYAIDHEVPAALLPITMQTQAGLMAGVSNDELGCCFD